MSVHTYSGVPGPWEVVRAGWTDTVRAGRATARGLSIGVLTTLLVCGVALAVFVLALVAVAAVLIVVASVVLAAIDTARERSARHTGRAMMDPTHPLNEERP